VSMIDRAALARIPRRLLRPLWVLLALIFLLEAWLWDHLEPLVAELVAHVPLERLKSRLAARIRMLSPRATLIVFLVPVVVLLPVKVAEVWLMTHRHFVVAIMLLLAAKLVGLGITAFIFDATRRKLLQIPWFLRLFNTVIRIRAWAEEIVAPVRLRLQQLQRVFAPKRAGRSFKLLIRLRRHMHAQAAS
jgi:hypothetical protein